MIYDFTQGALADLIREEFLREIEEKSRFQYTPITITDFKKLRKIGDAYYAKEGEDIYHMFMYKARFHTQIDNKLPVYHIADCRTIKEYTGFTFASEMPVGVYCLDQNKDLGKQALKLCGNCKGKLSLFSMFSGDKAWYEAILELATKMSKRGYATDWIKTDGYTSDWKQVSMAIRLRDGLKCTSCHQQFTESSRYFLEVHHRDANKENNRQSNLQSLCVKCHSQVDERHRTNFASDKGKQKLTKYEQWLKEKGNNQANITESI